MVFDCLCCRISLQVLLQLFLILNCIGKGASKAGSNNFDSGSKDENSCQQSGKQSQEVIQCSLTGLIEGLLRSRSVDLTAGSSCRVFDCSSTAREGQFSPPLYLLIPVVLSCRSTTLEGRLDKVNNSVNGIGCGRCLVSIKRFVDSISNQFGDL